MAQTLLAFQTIQPKHLRADQQLFPTMQMEQKHFPIRSVKNSQSHSVVQVLAQKVEAVQEHLTQFPESQHFQLQMAVLEQRRH